MGGHDAALGQNGLYQTGGFELLQGSAGNGARPLDGAVRLVAAVAVAAEFGAQGLAPVFALTRALPEGRSCLSWRWRVFGRS